MCTERSPGLRSTILRRLLASALAEMGRPAATVSVVLTADGVLQRLNRDFLEIDAPTDVLSFPLADPDALGDPSRSVYLGEIYISLERARQQARAAARAYPVEVAHLAIHGLLHLLGYDHATAPERRRMRALESRLLRASAAIIAKLGAPSRRVI